jgi:predicted O-methyltransferase YrrM
MDYVIKWKEVQEYLHTLVPQRPSEMQEMEAYARKKGFPAIGPVCGHLCYQFARMLSARRIFELGSGYGYSTAWFAKAVKENGGGQVYHVVWDEKLSDKARAHLDKLGYGDIVTYRVSEAVTALKETQGPFDIIFNDIDKEGYPDSLPVIKEKLRSGGILIIDNMLWDGRIFDGKNKEESTEAIREFTKQIVGDPDWIVTLVPIRDGMIIGYKK